MSDSKTVQHQAEAWVHTVTMLVVDYGLDSAEDGEVALEQVLNFLRRRLPEPISTEGYDSAIEAIRTTEGSARSKRS